MKDFDNAVLSEQFWERYFTAYDELNKLYPYQELIRRVIEVVRPQKSSRILDAGAGTGNFAVALKKFGSQVVAIDPNKSALSLMLKKDSKITSLQCSLQEVMNQQEIFIPDFYDTVVCINVLYTIPPTERSTSLRNLYQLLRRGGKIVLVNPEKNFSIVKFCTYTIKMQCLNDGLFKTIKLLIVCLPKFLKIFYYNIHISRNLKKTSFLENGEQEELLLNSGFTKIIMREKVYAHQSELVVAEKT